jgi:uncharacterized protein YndB with AHSA1/START domain/DNA-binding transcriptional ArsR family regulator
MVQSSPSADLAFAALSDRTRRGILERLGHGDASISDLAANFEMTLTGMKKHVTVLEDAGLVTTRKIGRVRQCELGPRRLEQETAWIADYQRMLEARLDRLGEFLEHTKRTALMTTDAQTSSISTPHDREIRIERVFDAPRDLVWRAFTERELIAQWWGRGNELTIERFEVEPGGHWRFVEHTEDDAHGFEGRYREVTPQERLAYTFEWDGMPGYVAIDTTTFEDLGDGRTRVVTTSLFHTTEERDGMLSSGMEQGLNQSYAALDRLLAKLG